MNAPSGIQLSLLVETHQGRPQIANPRMASNVLLHMLDQAGLSASAPTPAQAVTFLRTVFPWAAIAAERTNGLPVTKTTIRSFLESPTRAIILIPPRPEEVEHVEALLEFVQRRQASPEQQAQIEAATADMLGERVSEVLITQDGIPSPLFAQDRSEATRLFSALPSAGAAEAAEFLIEAFVLLRANHSDVSSGIDKLFWIQDEAFARSNIGGCADGQARAFLRDWFTRPEEKRRKVLSSVKPETLAVVFDDSEAQNA